MYFQTNIPLKDYTTMKLGGYAKFIAEAFSPQEVADIYAEAKNQGLPVFILGGGSNVIARDSGFDGIVILNKIPGFEIIDETDTDITIKVGAGEIWDNVVQRTTELNLSGIEAMSGIPGTTGAGPIQNVGAYGQEFGDHLISLEAYDIQNDCFVTLQNEKCGFAYRDSYFKNKFSGRYFITSVTFKLSKAVPTPPFYESLQNYLDKNNITDYSPKSIRNAVLTIRENKLPNPDELPNSGSFFKNAIINNEQAKNLQNIDPNAPLYDMKNGYFKVPSGWLIEQSGLKGQVFNGIKIYDKNALVLVNESAKSYHDLEIARQKIIEIVKDKFGIEIQQEPLEI